MLETIIRFISFHPEISVIGAITIIQIAPIKLDPWGAIAKTIRRLLVGEIDKKLDTIGRKVDDLEEKFNEDKALRSRMHILQFADELYNKKEHSKEYFDNILDDIDMYDKYCDGHPKFKNNKTVMSAGLIKDTYERLLAEHKF